MATRIAEARKELKDRHFTTVCEHCGAKNHVLVTYDVARNHSPETGGCWQCHAPVHEESCFLIWTGASHAIVDRYAGQAARLRRAL